MSRRFPAIPEPSANPESLRDAVLALKKAVEILTRQAGAKPRLTGAVIWQDLVDMLMVAEEEIPGPS